MDVLGVGGRKFKDDGFSLEPAPERLEQMVSSAW